MDKKDLFLNKYCKLEKSNGFLLSGTVIDIDEFGVLFRTAQKTAFIAWTEIKQLIPKEYRDAP